MTDVVQAEAEEILSEIDRRGGALAAIDAGWPQQEIREAAYRFQKGMEAKDVLVVGVNAFEDDEPVPVEVFSVEPTIEREQAARVTAVRQKRDAARAEAALANVERAATNDLNLMPPISRGGGGLRHSR